MLFKKIAKTKKFLLLKTTIITVMAASAVAFSSGPVALATSSNVTTIYQVYLNGTYIGNVTDKRLVDQLVDHEIKEAKKTLKDVTLKFGPQVQYIPEQVLHATANNQETLQTIKNSFQLQAEASAIVIDGKPVVYLENKDAAEDVVKSLKLQYVTEEQLKELEDRKASDNTALPALKENETRILDVRLSKDVSIHTENVAPKDILSIKEAVTFLQKGTLVEQKYVVQEGDVLETIAANHGLSQADLLAINPGLTSDSLLKIGQELNVTVPQPYVAVIVDKEASLKEEIAFANEVVEDSSMPKGETKEKQAGLNGSRLVNYLISEQNGVTLKKDQTSEQIIQQPVNHILIKGTKVIPSRGEGTFAWPTVGGYISSKQGHRWGKMHKGIDIARPSNKTIKAADNGVVVSAGWDSGGYGNKVIIDHKNGFRTLYAHMSSIKVSVGQTVSKGTPIGIMGATGNVTGVHLHFEVYKNGSLVNPLSYLR